MENKIREEERRLPYPEDYCYQKGLIAHFRFNIGDPVQVRGLEYSGIIVAAAVNHTGGLMYSVDNGNREKWLSEGFLRLNRPIGPPPPPGPQPLRQKEE